MTKSSSTSSKESSSSSSDLNTKKEIIQSETKLLYSSQANNSVNSQNVYHSKIFTE